MSLRDWHILRQLSPDFLATVRIAFVFGQTGNEALVITGDDKFYGVGKNTSYCLGFNGKDSTLPYLNAVLSDKNVDGFTCGGNAPSELFVIAHLQNGEIYQWGSLPLKSYYGAQPSPVRVEFGVGVQVKVKAVACGVSHCMIVSDDGRVFTWGRNDKGQLGIDGNARDYPSNILGTKIPTEVGGVIKGKVVTDISCGAEFSIVVLEDGKVFSWGSNMNGQLGINTNQVHTSTVPIAVMTPKNVTIEKIACGSSHVLALSKNQELYVWGNNNCSQLGESAPKEGITYVLRVEFESNLRPVDICASYACDLSVVQCESGEIYMWGKISTGKIIGKPTNSACESIHQVFASYASPNMMPRPLRHILAAKRRTSMLKTLENEFGNPENSDLTIMVENREIYVHQSILKMRSIYFRSMLSRWLKKNEQVVTIKKKKFITLEAYLKYLYTDQLEVNLDLAVELLQLGDEYGDENFKLLCEQSIKRDLTADKVAEIFAFTRKLETCKELNRFCFDFALKNAKKVINSEGFKKWNLDTMTAFTIGYVNIKETGH